MKTLEGMNMREKKLRIRRFNIESARFLNALILAATRHRLTAATVE